MTASSAHAKRVLVKRPDPDDVARALPHIFEAAAKAAGVKVEDIPVGAPGPGNKQIVRVAVAVALVSRRVRVRDALAFAHVGITSYHQRYNRHYSVVAAAKKVAEELIRTATDSDPRPIVEAALKAAADAEGITIAEASTANTRRAVRARRTVVRTLHGKIHVKTIAQCIGFSVGTCWRLISGKHHSPRLDAEVAASSVC